jgi:hypothetical protein
MQKVCGTLILMSPVGPGATKGGDSPAHKGWLTVLCRRVRRATLRVPFGLPRARVRTLLTSRRRLVRFAAKPENSEDRK